ncbi:hypothetical protein DNTS_035051 [Danionella cerebrum]|uniref:TFIIB-type domain-containing protein n=1 Tax=Danionella cerebrum TaxID=2873325 RepID=A0A553MRP1_9TELE|nr:hypothetical protein DNTS_035051 [Danionella translucida]
MEIRCAQCGSSRVLEDELYSERQKVCEDCGAVVCEVHLTTTLTEETQSRGFSRVRELCAILRLSGSMESQAVSLYERAYNHPNFLHVTINKKRTLGGSCILYVCRQNNWPISMETIGNLLSGDSCTVGEVYQEMIKSLNIETNTVAVTDLLESFCSDFKLAPGQVDEVLSEAPQTLFDRSSALLELAAETWILTGRQLTPMFSAVLYTAWQSLNPMARMKYSFVKFCQIAKAPHRLCSKSKKTVHKRLTELLEVLCKLGRELPWLRGELVMPLNVHKLVDCILKNQKVLLFTAMKNYEQKIQEELEERQSDEDACDEKHPENPSEEEWKDGELPLHHWGKKHLFLPPCVKCQKRKRVEELPIEVNGDEEISDGEIESYLRTDDEVGVFVKAKKELKLL